MWAYQTNCYGLVGTAGTNHHKGVWAKIRPAQLLAKFKVLFALHYLCKDEEVMENSATLL